MVVRIWAKRSDFICEYFSQNISCNFYWSNWHGSMDTLLFTFPSEHGVVHWIVTNNESNFAQLLANSSNVSVMNVSCTQYLNIVFKMFTSCSNRLRPTAACTMRHTWTRLIDPAENRLQRAKDPVFIRTTCFYRFSPKSLLAKHLSMHFVFITHFTHHNVNECQ